MWREAINVKYYGDTSVKLDRTFWDKLLGHVAAVTDTPANMFGPELIASYPEAKVVLVERDVEKWYPSFENALIKGLEIPLLPLIVRFNKDAARMTPVRNNYRAWTILLLERTRWKILNDHRPSSQDHSLETLL